VRVFITGAGGFVGTHVTRRVLTEGCEVAALVRGEATPWRLRDVADRVTVIRGDLSQPESWRESLRAWRPDACLHLAWYVEPGKYLHASENLVAMNYSLSLLTELIAMGCPRIVMVGTCAEYDTDPGYLCEDGPTRPATLYGATKLCTGLIGQQLASDAGVSFAWARLFYPYGPFEDTRRAVPALVRALLRGERFEASSGEQVRDYVHAEDIAGALWHLLRHALTGVYNVCSGVPVSIRDMMILIAKIATGRVDLIDFGQMSRRSWDPPMICGDNRRLRETGWSPRFTLEQGLRETVQWWKEHENTTR
jgi:nucleoside-diphosphate-sugar epimerase